MSNSPAPAKTSAPPRMALPDVSYILGASVRWLLLAELATGEPLRVVQLARAVGETPDNVSKHLTEMRRFGVTVLGKNGLHRLADHLMPARGQREIDFGHCVVRLREAVVAGKRDW